MSARPINARMAGSLMVAKKAVASSAVGVTR
jgi:hypothetical protein